MKTVEIEDATAPLAAYVRDIGKGSVVVLKRGKAMAAVIPLGAGDWEDLVVSQDPGFVEVLRRSDERYRAEGGIPFEEACRKFGHTPSPARRSRKAR